MEEKGTYHLTEGEVIDERYKIDGLLGEGGFAVVYIATQLNIKRPVAIKVLKITVDDDPKLFQRLMREAGTAAQLRHPNVVTIFDVGTTNAGYPFIVMEPFAGRNLKRVLRIDGPMDPRRAIKLFIGALGGLAAAHKLGIVHRDLKPNNLILTEPGTPEESLRLIDFGTARIIGVESDLTGKELTGTPAYVPPECIKNPEFIGPTIDVYQMGLILVEMLTARKAVQGDTSYMQLISHVHGKLNIPDALRDGSLGQVIAKATHIDAAERYQHAGQFMEALESLDTIRLAQFPAPPMRDNVSPDFSGSTEWSIGRSAIINPELPPGTVLVPASQVYAQPAQGGGQNNTVLWAIAGLLVLLLVFLGSFFFFSMNANNSASNTAPSPSQGSSLHTFILHTEPAPLEVVNADNGAAMGFSPVQMQADMSKPVYVQIRKDGKLSPVQRVEVSTNDQKVMLYMESWVASLQTNAEPKAVDVEPKEPEAKGDEPKEAVAGKEAEAPPSEPINTSKGSQKTPSKVKTAGRRPVKNNNPRPSEPAEEVKPTKEEPSSDAKPTLGAVDDAPADRKKPRLGTIDDDKPSRPRLGTIDDGDDSKPSFGTVD